MSVNVTWETMTKTLITMSSVPVRRDLVTAEVYELFNKCWVGFRLVVCLGGMAANGLNIRTFIRMGMGESMTVAFFALAITDCLYLAVACVSSQCMVVMILAQDFHLQLPVHPFVLYYFTGITASIFKDAGMFIITFLAIQRSLCVLRPLSFKGMLTRSRTIAIVVFIVTYCIVTGSILMSQNGVAKVFNGETNSSIFILTYKPGFTKVVNVLYIMSGLVINLSRQVIVLASVFIMSHALAKSVQFRNATSASVAAAPEEKRSQSQNSSHLSKGNAEAQSNSNTKHSFSKERQVVIQVALICSIFLISNISLVLVSIAGLIFPGFQLQGEFHFTFTTVTGINDTLELLNAAVNFFVYYKYNSKFRAMCFRVKEMK